MNSIKLIAASIGLFFFAATPAFGYWGGYMHPTVTMTYNSAVITNDVSSLAVTGGNTQGNTVIVEKAGVDEVAVEGNNVLTTGKAMGETSSIVVANVSPSCNTCAQPTEGFFHFSQPSNTFTTNTVVLTNRLSGQVSSGENMQGNGISITQAHTDETEVGGNNTLTTGMAVAKTRSIVVVNTQWDGAN